MKQLTVKRNIMLLILVLLLGIKTMSCDGGLDIGSMLGCEDTEGMRTLEWGEYPPDKKIYNMGMVRLTRSGFEFVNQNAIPLIEAAMGGSLTVPVDEVSLGLCKLCNGGCEVPIEIANLSIEPVWPDKLHVRITLPQTTSSDPWISLQSSCCFLGGAVTVDTQGAALNIDLDILVDTDNDTGYLKFDLVMPNLENIINSLNFSLCGIGDGFINLIKDAFRGLLESLIRGLIEDQLTALTCTSCADGKACPAHPDGYQVSCVEDICRIGESADDECMPLALGLEAEVNIGALLKDFVPDLEAKIWASLVVGGQTLIEEQGLELGIFGGTMSPPDAPESCAGYEEYPLVADGLTQLDFLTPNNMNEHFQPPREYHAGIGLREELLDQAGYAVNNSGLLCMALDQNTPQIGQYVGPGIFALLLPDMNIYTGGENVAWQLALEPGPPIDFEIMDKDNAYPDDPNINVDVALKVKIRDLNLHFYGLVEGRLVRMFTLQIDANVLVGLDAQGNSIEIQLDQNSIVLENYRIAYSIDSLPPEEAAEKFEGLIGGLLDTLLGDLLGGFEPIEIPGFDINGDDVNDIFIDIQTIAPEDQKPGVNDYQGLYVYAAIDMGGNKSSFRAETSAELVDSFLPEPQQYVTDGLKPYMVLRLSGQDADDSDANLEYSISVDNGNKWTPFRSGNEVTIDSNVLLLEGEHTILVRSRDKRDKSSIDLSPEAFIFTTDFTYPTLRMMRVSDGVKFIGKDNVSKNETLQYRVRLNDQQWSEWSEENMFDLNTVQEFPVTVAVQVRDEAGLVSEKEKTYNGVNVETFTVKEPREFGSLNMAASNGSTSEAAEALGCSSSNSTNAWFMLLMLIPLAFVRRMKTSKAMMLPFTMLLAFGLFACSSGGSTIDCVTTGDCDDGFVCVNGECQPSTDGDGVDGDLEIPDGDKEDVDGDLDAEDKEDAEEDEGITDIPCDEDGGCPTCFRCKVSTNMCVLQYCDPECDDPRVPKCEDTDSCSFCDTSNAIYECELPRCDQADPDSCDCRDCSEEGEGFMPVCKATGVCGCEEPCQCGEDEACCTKDNPSGDCMTCPEWCEGVTCEPGYAPGGCSKDNVTVCSWWEGDNPLWQLCGNFDDAVCEFSGVGMPDHTPSCSCQEMAPLPIGWHGSYSDMEVFEFGSKDELWISAYNQTYGDLMVGRINARGIGIDEIFWDYVDGVPDIDPNAAPSGPRGGVVDKGDDMGAHSSIAVSSDGWPRVAYQDVDNGDLVLIFTNGEAPEVEVVVDGDEDGDEEIEDAEDSEEEVEDAAKGFKDVDGDVEDAEDDTPAYDEYARYRWYKVVIDQEGDNGYYTDIWLDDQNRPVIAYMMKSDETGTMSELRLAMAKTATPQSADDFTIITLDAAAIGTPYCKEGECPEVVDTPFGLGINPSIMAMPTGSGHDFWVNYYHNTTYRLTSVVDKDGNVIQAMDNEKFGNLKRARMTGLPDADTTTAGTFTVENLVGHAGSLVNGDVGEFNSGYVIESNGWYVISFYNKTLNQLQVIFDFGSGLKAYTMDDGWREDSSNESYQVRIGADCSVGVDSSANIYVMYQDMTNNKLMAYSGNFATGNPPSMAVEPFEIRGMDDALDGNGNALEHGLAYGFYPKLIMMDGDIPLVSSFAYDMNSKEKLIHLILDSVLAKK